MSGVAGSLLSQLQKELRGGVQREARRRAPGPDYLRMMNDEVLHGEDTDAELLAMAEEDFDDDNEVEREVQDENEIENDQAADDVEPAEVADAPAPGPVLPVAMAVVEAAPHEASSEPRDSRR